MDSYQGKSTPPVNLNLISGQVHMLLRTLYICIRTLWRERCVMCACVFGRDLLTRVLKRNMKEKQKTSPDNVTDPLGEIYFQTLVRWI